MSTSVDIRALHKQIKRKSWNTRQAVLRTKPEGFKFLSTYAINNLLTEPKDWNAIAERCSTNPNHKFFGKEVAWIREQWSSKGAKAANTGIKLDDYIGAKLNGHTLNKETMADDLRTKAEYFDETYDKYFSKLKQVGSEMWLSSKLGLSVRFDTLFLRPQVLTELPAVLIAEWKNCESISTEDRWNSFEGPASHIQASDLAKFTFQMHIYRYILEEYGILGDVQVRLFQYATHGYYIHKEAFDYDPKFIEAVVAYCFEERDRRAKDEEN